MTTLMPTTEEVLRVFENYIKASNEFNEIVKPYLKSLRSNGRVAKKEHLKMVEMRKDGKKYREIGKHFGVTAQRVEQIIKSYL